MTFSRGLSINDINKVGADDFVTKVIIDILQEPYLMIR